MYSRRSPDGVPAVIPLLKNPDYAPVGLWVIVAMKVRSKTTYSYLFRKIHRQILHYKGRQTCDICSLANRFLRLGMVKAHIESARTKSSLLAYYT